MKNSNDTNGNRTRNLPVYSAVPQPTAPPCTPPHFSAGIVNVLLKFSEMLHFEGTGTQRHQILNFLEYISYDFIKYVCVYTHIFKEARV